MDCMALFPWIGWLRHHGIFIYHKGTYNNLRDSYNIILKYIENNGYEIIDNVRECYIDGCWNKENEADYLTEIQFPVKKR